MIAKKLVSLCERSGAFAFQEEEFRQHRGLAMGSSLSAIMALLFMESFEKNENERIMGRGAVWYAYVDKVIGALPENTNLQNKLLSLKCKS